MFTTRPKGSARREIKTRRIDVSLGEELRLLKTRAQALQSRLGRLNRRVDEIEQGPRIGLSVAVIDSDKCLGCGICETTCPVGAVAVGKTAGVNPARCIGCGKCVPSCPQGAIKLQPAGFSCEGNHPKLKGPRGGSLSRRPRSLPSA
ncbi:MAG: 4Fe-4S binding protein [Deltaproteobacteria bacterium]|nr:4Fe-4S binding protein [Deltaproteobacteria bacterium]